MKDTKTEFCNVIIESPTNERNELIKEYLTSYKVSNRVESLLVSLMCEVV